MDKSLALSNEEKNLYNPAYVGTIIYQGIRECQARSSKGLHCSLPYLLTPLALSHRYSQLLPSQITTPLVSWFSSNEGSLAGFSKSASTFIDITNSALLFLLEQNAIVLDANGFYQIEDDRLARLPAQVSRNPQFKHEFQSAGLLGRWFAGAISPDVIYTQLGVAP